MERDFMGLTVKQETPDEPIDAAPVRSLAMQWSFSNKSSAVPQLLSFQEGKPKTGFDSLAATGLVTITTSDSFNSDRKSFSGGMQSKNIDANPLRLSITNHLNPTATLPMNTAVSHNLMGTMSPQPISVVPVANPVPSGSPVVGTTDLRTTSKISKAPAQLTIFYNGSVCVYDGISPEKAQAIMLLAGNGPTMASSSITPAAPAPVPVQAVTPRSSPLDGFVISSTMPLGPSHVPATIVNVSQSVSCSASINDLSDLKPLTRVLIPPPEKAEPLKSVYPIGSVPPVTFLSSATTVPQFRRKSLARFLERRKERVISEASPYNDKKSPDCSSPGNGSTSISVNSSGSCPVRAVS